MHVISRVVRLFWGDVSSEDGKKFGILAITFFFIIGTYWLLRPLKESIFFHTVGGSWQPIVKQITIVFVFILAAVYSKLIDIFHRQTLFYVIGAVYSLIFLSIAYLLMIPEIGLSNPHLSPWRLIGWVSYLSIESFGYLMAAHFWAFVASITDSEHAKKGYPIIIAFAQLGAIIGSIWAANARRIEIEHLMLGGVASIICIMLSVWYFVKTVPRSSWKTDAGHGVGQQPQPKTKTGFFEGLWLLVTRPYLFGIFAIVFFYEVMHTIVDYQMLTQAKLVPEYATAGGFAAFSGFFGICSNSVSFLLALLGTSYMMRRLGLVFCLLTFPVTLGIVLAIFALCMLTGVMSAYMMLWSLFGMMVLTKGLSYALNNPAKEMMYIPTSKDAKFKAKSWIDVFGARTAKGAGAQINSLLIARGDLFFLQYGSLIGLVCVGIWICWALFVGRTFQKLTHDGEIVE